MKPVDRASRPPGGESKLYSPEFKLLSGIIHEETGLYYPENKCLHLQSRLMLRLQALQLSSFEEYVDYLLDPSNFSELLQLINVITPPDTSFFRSAEQFEWIGRDILPALVRQKKQIRSNTLRLWSAACATGEEVYSLAMLVHARLLPAHRALNFEIVGSDINTTSLQLAETGRYQLTSKDRIPPAFLQAYFAHDGGAFVLDEAIRQMVTLKRINLSNRTDMMRMHEVDLIFCANVLSSFSQEMKQKTLQAFYNCMAENSYLVIGATEAMLGLEHPFLELNVAGFKVFQKCT